MAISLKNIEDRVIALENKISSGSSITSELISGWRWFQDNQWYNICDLETLNKYDFLVVSNSGNTNDRSSNSRFNHCDVVPVVCLNADPYWTMGGSGEDKLFIIKNDNGLYVKNGWTNGNDNGINWIYGLKLYYSFSYNITYKILSSIKFQAMAIFSLHFLEKGV